MRLIRDGAEGLGWSEMWVTMLVFVPATYVALPYSVELRRKVLRREPAVPVSPSGGWFRGFNYVLAIKHKPLPRH